MGASSTALENSSRLVIGWPSTDTILSPTRRPASAAGLPSAQTRDDQARSLARRVKPRAASGAIIRPR